MAPESKKIAKEYVNRQVELLGQRVPKKSVNEAVRKVAEVLEEVRTATAEHKQQQQGITLK